MFKWLKEKLDNLFINVKDFLILIGYGSFYFLLYAFIIAFFTIIIIAEYSLFSDFRDLPFGDLSYFIPFYSFFSVYILFSCVIIYKNSKVELPIEDQSPIREQNTNAKKQGFFKEASKPTFLTSLAVIIWINILNLIVILGHKYIYLVAGYEYKYYIYDYLRILVYYGVINFFMLIASVLSLAIMQLSKEIEIEKVKYNNINILDFPVIYYRIYFTLIILTPISLGFNLLFLKIGILLDKQLETWVYNKSKKVVVDKKQMEGLIKIFQEKLGIEDGKKAVEEFIKMNEASIGFFDKSNESKLEEEKEAERERFNQIKLRYAKALPERSEQDIETEMIRLMDEENYTLDMFEEKVIKIEEMRSMKRSNGK